MGLLSDIENFETLDEEKREFLLAYLVAVASLLSVIDGWLPKPLPLAKIGLANIVTLVLVMKKRYRIALLVAFLRVMVSHALGGTLITFGFWLSLSGSVFSSVVMGVTHRFFGKYLSLYGISLWGGWAHALAQGVMASVFLGWNRGVVLYVAFLMAIGVGTSLVIAWIADRYLQTQSEVDENHQDQ
ncbi:Gx transporter family protein [Thermospira aquatica]|uniref:Gx transporter family protein n=1 Tax=Thermospira aquatica TaxID=2828656 RepID=A0AAX3BDC2_9SPIR|nr:Gx transporter family protein [Thermospira aquatica]URA10221.1 Gx transporter family protein [Thermospira aquatica]